MVDWLTWPAELVLNAGGIVASWFVSKDSISFVALQMGFAFLCIFASVSWILAIAFTPFLAPEGSDEQADCGSYRVICGLDTDGRNGQRDHIRKHRRTMVR